MKVTKEELLNLQNKYLRDAGIGRYLNCSRQNVHQMRNRYGIPALKDPNKARNDSLFKAWKEGRSIKMLAHDTKLSLSQMYRIIWRMEAEEKAAEARPEPVKAAMEVV